MSRAQYMEGQCAVLAIAIHRFNPQRFILGYVFEYNDSADNPDMYLEPDEYAGMSSDEQKEIALDSSRWSLVHAYVYDNKTKEYIDAAGRHKTLPMLGYDLNLSRKLVFPATENQVINASTHMRWNDTTDEWIITKGKAAFDIVSSDIDIQTALNYAKKNLDIV